MKWKFKTQNHTCFNTFRFKFHLKTFRPTYGPFTFSYSFYLFTLRNLYIEANRAHRLYDAALLTRCYTQHIRHFIKIQFVNKGIEFNNLPCIFIYSIPSYFENKESPIICYKYNKHICSTVFNYNEIVTELGPTIPDF